MGYTSNRLRVLVANGKDFQITPREMENIAGQLDEKDAELDRLTAQLAAARVAVEESWRMAQEKLDWRDHYWGRNCSVSEANPCCDSEAYNGNLMALRRKLDEARHAVGLEEGK